jgi:hypothetical protein
VSKITKSLRLLIVGQEVAGFFCRYHHLHVRRKMIENRSSGFVNARPGSRGLFLSLSPLKRVPQNDRKSPIQVRQGPARKSRAFCVATTTYTRSAK